jgi:ATP-dependent Zn protease
MKTALALLLFLTSLGMAEEQKDEQKVVAPDNGGTTAAKRIKSITWDIQNQKLVWVVEDGTSKNGQFTASSEQRYEISPKDKAMTVQGEKRGFGDDEAVWLQHVLNIITMYCAESVVWWLDGQGEKPGEGSPNKTSPPDKAPEQQNSKPTKIKVFNSPNGMPGLAHAVAAN